MVIERRRETKDPHLNIDDDDDDDDDADDDNNNNNNNNNSNFFSLSDAQCYVY